MIDIDAMIYESKQRYKWYITGKDIHCIPSGLFMKIPTERLCELYNVEMSFFKEQQYIEYVIMKDGKEITYERVILPCTVKEGDIIFQRLLKESKYKKGVLIMKTIKKK